MRNTFLALAAALTLSAAGGCGLMHHWCGPHCDRGDDCCDCDDCDCSHCGPRSGSCDSCDSGNCGGGKCAAGGYAEGGCGPGACGNGDCQQCGYAGCPVTGGPLCRAGACAAGCCGCGVTPAVADQLGGPAGPPCAQVTYPYYTVRGPRDFLAAHPTGIGP